MKKLVLFVSLSIMLNGLAFSQESLPNEDTVFAVLAFKNNTTLMEGLSDEDTVPAVLERLNTDLAAIKKLKISGYIQAQAQFADTAGIESVAGGNFPAGIDNRMGVRRGRIKFLYDNNFSTYVLQIDATEKGVVIKDAYLNITDPWLKTFGITAGVFDRPFGYEISYSSSLRESPERSRIFQALFPGERDMGAKLVIQPPKTSRYNFMKFEGGLFNGTGPNAVDFDNFKDVISRLSFNKSMFSERFNMGVGFSYYNGGWKQGTKYTYKMTELPLSDGAFTDGFLVDSIHGKIGSMLRREYKGIDAQFIIETPIGITILRGEYIMGRQPGTSKSTSSPTSQPVESTIYKVSGTIATPVTANSDAYLRDFEGGYFYLVQGIMQTRHQLVLKYDWYDPNVEIRGDAIGVRGTKTGSADIQYATWGFGWIVKLNTNVKLMTYYDMPTNEASKNLRNSSRVKTLSRDRTDNVLTIRLQYKF